MENSPIETAAAIETRAAFTIDAKALATATKFLRMRIALKVGRHDSIKPASLVRVTARPCGSIVLEASDNGYLGARIALQGDVASPGAFATAADTLDGAAQKAAKASTMVTVEDGEERIAVKAGRASLNLKRRAPDMLPEHPTGGTDATLSAEFSAPLAQFVADVKALQPAVGTEDRRTHLHMIAMQRRELAGRERLLFLATDGSAAAFASRELPAGAESLPDCGLPSNALPALLDLAKIGDGESVAIRLEHGKHGDCFTLTAGRASVSFLGAAETMPDIMGAVIEATGEAGEQAPLFPELLPGAPTAQMEKLAKKSPGAIDWEQRGKMMLGACADPGLFFGAMRMTGEDSTGKKGFSYTGSNGERGEIVGPDGVTYPVPFKDNGAAIGLTAKQVRELIGDSCFETLEFTGTDGHPRHVARWLWDDGASRFLIVQPDGRCPAEGEPREYVTREEIEAALAAAESHETAPEGISMAQEPVNALSEPEILPVAQSEGEADPTADIIARLEALEAAIATLPDQSIGNPTGATEAARSKRSAAHARMIRRAWAERKARRLAMAIADDHMRMRDIAQSQLRHTKAQLAAKHTNMEKWADEARKGRWSTARRLRAAQRARRMLIAARKRYAAQSEQLAKAQHEAEAAREAAKATLQEATDARQGQQAARAELARLRADMVDPSQPERASDIVRLKRERDESRNANAALLQRCERAEQARDKLADEFAGLVSRVTIAEAAVRRLQAA